MAIQLLFLKNTMKRGIKLDFCFDEVKGIEAYRGRQGKKFKRQIKNSRKQERIPFSFKFPSFGIDNSGQISHDKQIVLDI